MKTNVSLCAICRCRLKDNTLFANLTESELHGFKNVVVTAKYAKKDAVFMEGDECKGLYIVRSGRVKLVRASRGGKEHIVKILSSGDILGFEVFYEAKNYTTNAMTMDDAELCFIDKRAFFSVLKKNPALASKLVISLGRELHYAYEKIGNLGLMNAREKLAHLLYGLADEYGVEEDGKVRLHLALSRLEIAELLGITQETSIRLLKGLEGLGILKIKRKEIIITSMEKLSEAGGGELSPS